jgi:hypothetical protein
MELYIYAIARKDKYALHIESKRVAWAQEEPNGSLSSMVYNDLESAPTGKSSVAKCEHHEHRAISLVLSVENLAKHNAAISDTCSTSQRDISKHSCMSITTAWTWK